MSNLGSGPHLWAQTNNRMKLRRKKNPKKERRQIEVIYTAIRWGSGPMGHTAAFLGAGALNCTRTVACACGGSVYNAKGSTVGAVEAAPALPVQLDSIKTFQVGEEQEQEHDQEQEQEQEEQQEEQKEQER